MTFDKIYTLVDTIVVLLWNFYDFWNLIAVKIVNVGKGWGMG